MARKIKANSHSVFEMVLVDVSTRLIALPADRVDSEIMLAQREICACLDIDISALWQKDLQYPGSLTTTHVFVPPDFSVPVPEVMDAKDTFPWSMKRLFEGEIIIISRMADLPAAAARDLELYQHFGIKSALTFPLSAGGGPVFGALSFNDFRKERAWSTELVGKLRLVAQVFANAIARKRTYEKLERSALFLTETAGIGKVGGWEFDIDTGKQTWTAETYNIHEVDPSYEPTMEKGLAFYTPASRPIIEQAVRRAIEHGTPYELELEIVTAKGHQRDIRTIGRADLAHRRVHGFIQDISVRKQNEREMTQLRLDLTNVARVMSLNEISTSLAHEINQPLGAILNNAEAAKILLSQAQDKREVIQEIVDDIIQDAKRAGDVVRRVRGIVKKADAHFEPLPTNTLIEDVLVLLKSSLAMSNVTLHLDLKPGLPNIRGDRIRLQQVLLNLVTNALEAMKETPSKLLTVRSAMQASDMVTVSISDSGPGIAEASRAALFQPFFTTKKDGLGLGLSICKSIIDEHGGKIWEDNNPGGGATFSFSLKAWREEEVLA